MARNKYLIHKRSASAPFYDLITPYLGITGLEQTAFTRNYFNNILIPGGGRMSLQTIDAFGRTNGAYSFTVNDRNYLGDPYSSPYNELQTQFNNVIYTKQWFISYFIRTDYSESTGGMEGNWVFSKDALFYVIYSVKPSIQNTINFGRIPAGNTNVTLYAESGVTNDPNRYYHNCISFDALSVPGSVVLKSYLDGKLIGKNIVAVRSDPVYKCEGAMIHSSQGLYPGTFDLCQFMIGKGIFPDEGFSVPEIPFDEYY